MKMRPIRRVHKCLILVMALCFMLSSLNAGMLPSYASSVRAEYRVGESVTATLYDGGLLVLSGQGDTWDYSPASPAPFYGQRGEIRSLRIENGVTGLGAYLFYNCGNLTGELTVPASVLRIGSYAFSGDSASEAPYLRYIYNGFTAQDVTRQHQELMSPTPETATQTQTETETATETVTETATETETETAAETVTETAAETVPETAPETVPETVPETETQTAAEPPVSEAAPEPEPEPAPAPEPEPEPAPKAEPVPAPKAEPAPAPEPEPAPAPQSDGAAAGEDVVLQRICPRAFKPLRTMEPPEAPQSAQEISTEPVYVTVETVERVTRQELGENVFYPGQRGVYSLADGGNTSFRDAVRAAGYAALLYWTDAAFENGFGDTATVRAAMSDRGLYMPAFGESGLAKPDETFCEYSFTGWSDGSVFCAARDFYTGGSLRFTAVFDAQPRAMAEQTVTAEAGGKLVTISGPLPEGAQVSAQALRLDRQTQALVEDAAGGELLACVALDISILVDGVKYQPAAYGSSVTVSVTAPELDATQELCVFHMDGSGLEELAVDAAQDDCVAFTADSFSTYIITVAADKSVTFPGGGFTVSYSIDGAGFTELSDYRVDCAASDTLYFRVAAQEGYVLGDVSVSGGAALDGPADGTYILSDITGSASVFIGCERAVADSAVSFDLGKGPVRIGADGYSGFAADGTALTGGHAAANQYIIRQSGAAADGVELADGIDCDLTLSGVDTAGMLTVSGGGSVTLRLAGTNALGGVTADGGALCVTSASGDGSLAGSLAAVIHTGGSLTVSGGSIDAQSAAGPAIEAASADFCDGSVTAASADGYALSCTGAVRADGSAGSLNLTSGGGKAMLRAGSYVYETQLLASAALPHSVELSGAALAGFQSSADSRLYAPGAQHTVSAATSFTACGVAYDLTGLTVSVPAAVSDGALTLTIAAQAGKNLPDSVAVTRGGEAVTDFTWANGVLTVSGAAAWGSLLVTAADAAAIVYTAADYNAPYDGEAHGIDLTVTRPADGYVIYYGTEAPLTAENCADGVTEPPVFTDVCEAVPVYWYIDAEAADVSDAAGCNTVTVTPGVNEWLTPLTCADVPAGEAPAPEAETKWGGDTIEYTYSASADGPFTAEVPAESGTYYVTAAVPGTDNYAALETETPVAFAVTSVTARGASGRVLSALGGNAVTSLSAAGAFTLRYDLYYVPDAENTLGFAFSAGLSAGIALTLLDLCGAAPVYYRYIAVGGETAVALSDFIRMGTAAQRAAQAGTPGVGTSASYQLCAVTPGGAFLTVSMAQGGLAMAGSAVGVDCAAVSVPAGSVSLTADGGSGCLTAAVSVTASGSGTKVLALRLTDADGGGLSFPDGASVTLQSGGASIPATEFRGGLALYSLGDGAADAGYTFTVTGMPGGTYGLSADICCVDAADAARPMHGSLAAAQSGPVTVAQEQQTILTVSLRGGSRLVAAGEGTALSFDVTCSGTPGAALFRKSGGSYSEAVSMPAPSVSLSGGSGTVGVTLPALTPGTYRIVFSCGEARVNYNILVY